MVAGVTTCRGYLLHSLSLPAVGSNLGCQTRPSFTAIHVAGRYHRSQHGPACGIVAGGLVPLPTYRHALRWANEVGRSDDYYFL